MERHRALTRRGFSAALVGLTAKAERRIEGSFVNESFALGHKLRDRVPFAAPKRRVKTPVVIVGGGIAGLSAAWRLDKRGFRDFVVLEMEPQPGGNSRWGQNDLGRFPWAAHYVPVPAKGESLARELFEELGVYEMATGTSGPYVSLRKSALFMHGRWQEGFEPETATGASRAIDESKTDRVSRLG